MKPELKAHFLWNSKCCYRVHKSPLLDASVRQSNPVHAHPVSWISILILSYILCLGSTNGVFTFYIFRRKLLYAKPVNYVSVTVDHLNSTNIWVWLIFRRNAYYSEAIFTCRSLCEVRNFVFAAYRSAQWRVAGHDFITCSSQRIFF